MIDSLGNLFAGLGVFIGSLAALIKVLKPKKRKKKK
ncbi:Uncharacterised protein [Trueperella bialowiezensis]|uniref:Uncharacterized protein n=1 Tax=Trueperella bialowiezensis TaxID=312285 RepID=A0A3S4WGA4_9ACTO|nr:Uncharacterised protein [Trueperella bialowiezensis]